MNQSRTKKTVSKKFNLFINFSNSRQNKNRKSLLIKNKKGKNPHFHEKE